MSLLPREDFLTQLRADDPPDCPICLEPTESVFTTTCGHQFCLHCIGSALERNHTCPCCRRELFQAPGTAPNHDPQPEVAFDDFRVTRQPVTTEQLREMCPHMESDFRNGLLEHLNSLIVGDQTPLNGNTLAYVHRFQGYNPETEATWLWAKPMGRPHLTGRDICDSQWEDVLSSVRGTLRLYRDQSLTGSELKRALINDARAKIGGVWPNYSETLTSGPHARRFTTDVRNFVDDLVKAAQRAYREKVEEEQLFEQVTRPLQQEHQQACAPEGPLEVAPRHQYPQPTSSQALRELLIPHWILYP